MRDRINMLLKVTQKGSEVLMSDAQWFRRSVRSYGWIHSKVLQETLEGKHKSSGLLCAELLNVRTMRKPQKLCACQNNRKNSKVLYGAKTVNEQSAVQHVISA